jgi:CheY-like chemotaxis protein
MARDPHTILYIDDDPDYIDAMRAILESAGYTMVAALSAEEGVRAFKAHEPVLVLVDLMMEEIDSGVTLVRDLRIVSRDVPIYMVSSAGDTLTLNTDVQSLGLAGIFQKPVDAENLLTVIANRLNRDA